MVSLFLCPQRRGVRTDWGFTRRHEAGVRYCEGTVLKGVRVHTEAQRHGAWVRFCEGWDLKGVRFHTEAQGHGAGVRCYAVRIEEKYLRVSASPCEESSRLGVYTQSEEE